MIRGWRATAARKMQALPVPTPQRLINTVPPECRYGGPGWARGNRIGRGELP